jgi:hypothetical protein
VVSIAVFRMNRAERALWLSSRHPGLGVISDGHRPTLQRMRGL